MQLDGVGIPQDNLLTWDVIKPFPVLFCSNIWYRDQYTERNQLEVKKNRNLNCWVLGGKAERQE